ncbi:MAG TPA: hypothetical protein VE032_02960 [Actinomycetota bacterium]|nr:hypothetical protein [Actinomycetota bacterium]
MSIYRLIRAEFSVDHGREWWTLTFDDGTGRAMVRAPEPPPEPFTLLDRRKLYSERELDRLRASS